MIWAEVSNQDWGILQVFSTTRSFADELSVRIMAANTMIEYAESEDERAIVRRMTECDRASDEV